MSGFLSRVAARAVGQAPVARPRVASVFEGARASSAEGGLEIVETEVAARPLQRSGARSAERALAAAEAAQAVQRAEAAGDRQQPRAEGAGPEPSAAPARPREPEAPTPETGRTDEPTVEIRVTGNRAEARSPVADTVAAEMLPETEQATATAVAAVPAARAKPEFASFPAAAQAATTSTAVAEMPTVRVHIGRLEVRANLHEAPSQRTLRSEPEPAGQSLADYLRARRTAS